MVEKFRGFDPAARLEKVATTPSSERKQALAVWKDQYFQQRSALVRTQVDLINRVREDPHIPSAELMKMFDDAAKEGRFSRNQIRIGHSVIRIHGARREIMRAARERFPDDAQLFKAIFGLTPVGEIQVREHPLHFTFACSNQFDLARARNFDGSSLDLALELLKNIVRRPQGTTLLKELRLPGLRGMVVVLNKNDEKEIDIEKHEEQHVMRQVFLAAESASHKEEGVSKAPEERHHWKELLAEYRDLIELDIEEEVLAQNAANQEDVLDIISEHYLDKDLIHFTHQLLDSMREIKSGISTEKYTKEEYEKVIEGLNDETFRSEIMDKAAKAIGAYNRLTQLGEYSNEETAAFLQLELLGDWPKVANRILERRQRA